MQKQTFIKILATLRAFQDKVSAANELGIGIHDFHDVLHDVIADLLKAHFGEINYDLISQQIYENPIGEIWESTEKGELIANIQTDEDLFEYIKSENKN